MAGTRNLRCEALAALPAERRDDWRWCERIGTEVPDVALPLANSPRIYRSPREKLRMPHRTVHELRISVKKGPLQLSTQAGIPRKLSCAAEIPRCLATHRVSHLAAPYRLARPAAIRWRAGPAPAARPCERRTVLFEFLRPCAAKLRALSSFKYSAGFWTNWPRGLPVLRPGSRGRAVATGQSALAPS